MAIKHIIKIMINGISEQHDKNDFHEEKRT